MKTFLFDNTILTKDKKATYLGSDVSATAISLNVQSVVGITTTGIILLIGEIGQEKTEIVQVSNGTVPTGTTIPLQTAVSFDHTQDTKIYVLDYNQFALSRATGVSTQKSTLSIANLQVDQLNSIYNDNTNTTGYGFVEFYDSINTRYSSPSAPIPYAGFADNSIYMIKKRALDSVNEKISTDLITDDFLNQKLAEARREYHNAPGKRPFRRSYNVDIGNVSTGMYRLPMPTDLQKPFTAENVFGVRIGKNLNLGWCEKKEIDFNFIDVPHANLNATYSIGNQDLYLDNTNDFNHPTGSVTIEEDVISYSAVGLGGTLRISTQGAYTHPTLSDVWQNASYTLPDKFSVWMDTDGTCRVYFNRILDTTYVNMNVWADYYRTLTPFTSDADTLDEPDNIQDGYVHFLAYHIKKRKDKGLEPLSDDDFSMWNNIKMTNLATEHIDDLIHFNPDVMGLPD